LLKDVNFWKGRLRRKNIISEGSVHQQCGWGN